MNTDKIKQVCEDLFLKMPAVKKVTVKQCGYTVTIEADPDNEHDLDVIFNTELRAYDKLPGEVIEFKVVPYQPDSDNTVEETRKIERS